MALGHLIKRRYLGGEIQLRIRDEMDHDLQ